MSSNSRFLNRIKSLLKIVLWTELPLSIFTCWFSQVDRPRVLTTNLSSSPSSSSSSSVFLTIFPGTKLKSWNGFVVTTRYQRISVWDCVECESWYVLHSCDSANQSCHWHVADLVQLGWREGMRLATQIIEESVTSLPVFELLSGQTCPRRSHSRVVLMPLHEGCGIKVNVIHILVGFPQLVNIVGTYPVQ